MQAHNVREKAMLFERIATLTGYRYADFRFTSSVGLFPSVFNLAENADIYTNATCGQFDSEVYCTLEGQSNGREQCGVCLASSPEKSHPIQYAVDQVQSSWWQSPSLLYGAEMNFVTVTLDLKRVRLLRLGNPDRYS